MGVYCTICKWYRENASDECKKKHLKHIKRSVKNENI